jgi:penicillin-binding protein 1C
LRPFTTADGRWRLPITVNDVDPRYLALLTAYEDKRFASHWGVDALAMLRAAWQRVRHGEIVSGGSTLTMQVARLLEPRPERSLGAKFRQMGRALWLERHLSKTDILGVYLSLAPYGGNLEGLRAASFAYFGKEPARLSFGEAALLVGLPQAPEARRPDRYAEAARGARDRVLARGLAAGLLSADDHQRARNEPVPTARRPFPMLAPHVAEEAVRQRPHDRVHRLTLDHRLQSALEDLARERVRPLGPKLSAAIVVVENATGDVLASVGGAEYLSSERVGSLDLTLALRSPGSALKPFVYALAFEHGIAHPETVLEDRPTRYGGYAPENFDLTFQGTVTARRALQLSLNVPTVDLLAALGAQRFVARMRDAGIGLVLPRDASPGLPVALGGLGITLADLTRAYVALARGGDGVPLRLRADAPRTQGLRLVEPVAAWYVADTLLGAPPPVNALAGRLAHKTGTSYGYRDAWAVGFDRRHTIGVWVGRADNGAVAGLVGRAVAAPILFDAFARLGLDPTPLTKPRDAISGGTSSLPPPLRHLRQDIPKTAAAITHAPLKFAFPSEGARIDLAASVADRNDGLMLKIVGGVPPFIYMVDGAPIAAPASRRSHVWLPGGVGFARISVIDGSGNSDSVAVRLQ